MVRGVVVVVAVGDGGPPGDVDALGDEHVVDPHIGEEILKVRPGGRRAVPVG